MNRRSTAIPTSVPDLLQSLRRDREAIAWPGRVEAAAVLRDQLQGGGGATGEVMALLDLLVSDEKPEVRHAVAMLLPLLGEAEFERASVALLKDSNAYVRRSAQRCASKRRQVSKPSRRRQKLGFDQVAHELQVIESRYGQKAAHLARRVSDHYAELLVGSMVHDLRSVLTHLRGNMVALAAEAQKAGAPQRLGKRVRDDVEFLERTVRDMERFTISLSGERTPAKLVELVEVAVEQARSCVRQDSEIDADTVRLEMQICPSIQLQVVPHLIVAALTNIIKNAYEALIVAGKGVQPLVIDIRAESDPTWVELRIRDNGMGFAPEELAAFRPFTPGRRNKAKRNSTGYGLPNAMRNIAAHGGTVEIASKENQGTTVTIRLPLETSLSSDREMVA